MTSITVEQGYTKKIYCKTDNSYIQDEYSFTWVPRQYRDFQAAIADAIYEEGMLRKASLSDLEQICKILNIDLTLPQPQETNT
jgi:hypothetical protein